MSIGLLEVLITWFFGITVTHFRHLSMEKISVLDDKNNLDSPPKSASTSGTGSARHKQKAPSGSSTSSFVVPRRTNPPSATGLQPHRSDTARAVAVSRACAHAADPTELIDSQESVCY